MAVVLLVNPQLATSGWGRGLRPQTMDDALPRHSLTFLSAPLKAAGHDVRLADALTPSGSGDSRGEATMRNRASEAARNAGG